MGKTNIIREYVQKHGAGVILDEILNYYDERTRVPDGLLRHLDYATGKTNASIVLKDTKVRIKGREISYMRMRPLLMKLNDNEFKYLATKLIEQAWFHGITLPAAHKSIGMLGFGDLGLIQRGILLKIIFSDKTFIYDRNDGVTTVRRRKASRMLAPQCIERAQQAFIDLKITFGTIIRNEQKKKEEVMLPRPTTLDDLI